MSDEHREFIKAHKFSGTYVLKLSDEIQKLKEELRGVRAHATRLEGLVVSYKPYYLGTVQSPWAKVHPKLNTELCPYGGFDAISQTIPN